MFELTQENIIALGLTGAGAVFFKGPARIIFGIAFVIAAARTTGLLK